MITCRQVARALHESDYARLGWWRRLALKFHVTLCFVCGRYHRQVMDVQDGVREYLKSTEADGSTLCLSEKSRERIKQALAARGENREEG